ncbi:MAG TPA: hypothetical protein VNV62_06795 [Trebonia sp.]|nr:hypothetical protein [Trebonia sp.]
MAGNNALSSAFYAQLTSLGVLFDGTDPVFPISLMRSAGPGRRRHPRAARLAARSRDPSLIG